MYGGCVAAEGKSIKTAAFNAKGSRIKSFRVCFAGGRRNGITKRFGRAVSVMTVLFMLLSLAGCSRINENVPDSGGITSAVRVDTDFDNSRYIYSQLSDEEKSWYDCIKDAVDSFSPTAVFPQKIDSEVMRKLFIAVYQQEESQFWLNSLFYRAGEESDVLYLDYRFTADEAERMQQEIDNVTDSIFSAFDENTDDYEKLKTFHDYLVTNCTFSKETDYGNTIYGALVDGYAQCEGYAFSYDYLCMLAGIDCFVATGTNSDGDLHAWNVVLLDGEWYHVDCTWDDPILSTSDPDFLRHFYFLVCDSDIIGRTHIIDSTYFSYPECSSAENYYEREGLSTSDADEGVGMLLSAAIRAVSEGKKEAAVRFTDQKAYENAVYKLFDGGGIKTVLAAANDYSDKKVQTGKYVRRLDDDLLIIHVSMVYEE